MDSNNMEVSQFVYHEDSGHCGDYKPDLSKGKSFVETCTYLKKSFLQNSLFSLVKHLSVRIARQSKHRTHVECHDRSKTLTRNLSNIALSHAAHVIIMMMP